MSIMGQGPVKLLCKQPNGASPFLLQLKNVYFIPDCTVNLVSTFQLSLDSIAFDSEVPCLKEFRSTEALCSISQINRHYTLNVIPSSKLEFMEHMSPNQDIYLILSPLEHTLLLWHRRLGHASLGKIRQAARTTEGIDLNIHAIKRLPFCEACAFGKSQKIISRGTQERTDRPGQKLHMDLVGPITPVGIGNVRWFLASADDYCRWRRVETLKHKGDAEEALQGMVNWAETQWNTKVQAIRLDGGREYGFTRLDRWAKDRGTKIETTESYTPHQNGVAERSIGLICRMARTMILDSGLPLYLWPEAINMAIEILNRLPTDALAGKVPYTLQDKQKRAPQMDFLRRFGQACIVHLPEETRVKSAKFSTRGQKGFIVGYKGTTIYRVWIPTGYGFGKVIESSSIRFDSTDLYENEAQKLQEDGVLNFNDGYSLELSNGRASLSTSSELGGERTSDSDVEDEELFFDRNTGEKSHTHTEQPEFHEEPLRAAELNGSLMHGIDNESRAMIPNEPRADSEIDSEPGATKEPSADSGIDSEPRAMNSNGNAERIDPVRDLQIASGSNGQSIDPRNRHAPRPRRTLRPTFKVQENQLITEILQQSIDPRNRHALMVLLTQCTEDADPEEPKTLQEALSSPNRTQWLSAIHAEVRSLQAKGVYRLVDRTLKMKVLGSKWVFKVKRDQDGNIIKFKARYVVKGFMQRFGVDYTDTYANVADIDTIRLLLAMACFYDWECDTVDIVTAFLNGDLEEEVYMDQIEGFEEGLAGKKVCMLLKSIYGLKQAPRTWQQSFYKHLRKLGFTQLRTDSAVFIRRSNGTPVIILIHVDDMAIMSPSRDLVDKFKRQLAEKFEIEDNGPISSFLGLKITRNRTARTLTLSQKIYIESLVKEFLHGESVNSKPTPLEPNQRLEPNQDAVDEKLRTEYQQLVGSLMWLALRTRLDIAYHVSILSRFLQNPSRSHWGAAKRVLRYLYGTKHFVITYSGWNSAENKPELGLQAFSDASFAMVQSKHSQSGFVCFAAGGPIAWYSSKQPIITLSSTEAEYVGLVTAARSVLSMSNLLLELGYHEKDRIPFRICGDNINALNAADNSGAIRSIKHLELRWRWLQQETAANRIKLEYVSGQEHPADGLTKSLTKPKHEEFVKLLGFRT
jgi:hypothetical protein